MSEQSAIADEERVLDEVLPSVPTPDPALPGFQAPQLSRYRPSERWADRWLKLRAG